MQIYIVKNYRFIDVIFILMGQNIAKKDCEFGPRSSGVDTVLSQYK